MTKRASDDIHFIARFTRIMIIIWLVLVVPYLIFLVLMVGGIFAALGSLGHLPR